MTAPFRPIAGDWYPLGIPANVAVGDDVYIDSSYAFAAFRSVRRVGLSVGNASGIYDRSALVVGAAGLVRIGEFTILNGTTIVCDESVEIGSHCLLAWGVVVADNWSIGMTTVADRRASLVAASRDPDRHPPAPGRPLPVTIEDNVWVGFDSVILPGVRLGQGCIVGCRSVVGADVPPYAVVGGVPARPIRAGLDAIDTDGVRHAALTRIDSGS